MLGQDTGLAGGRLWQGGDSLADDPSALHLLQFCGETLSTEVQARPVGVSGSTMAFPRDVGRAVTDTAGNTNTSKPWSFPPRSHWPNKEDRTADTSKEKVCDAKMSVALRSHQPRDLPGVALATLGR